MGFWIIGLSKFRVAGVTTLVPGGVLKFHFIRDVPLQNLKVDTYKYQFFKKK